MCVCTKRTKTKYIYYYLANWLLYVRITEIVQHLQTILLKYTGRVRIFD